MNIAHTRHFFVFVALFACVAFVTANNSQLECPTVFDGLTNGHFDLSTQFSTSALSANWVGLGSSQILSYEWAIISEAKLNKASADAKCRSVQGFVGTPDVLNWVSVRKETSASASGLTLVPKTKYFVVLRTTLTNGKHVYSNSNGITILPQELKIEGNNNHERSTRDVLSKGKQTRATAQIDAFYPECSIDNENRCRKAAIPVRDQLAELYGPPVYPIEDPLFLLFRYPLTGPAAVAIGVNPREAGVPAPTNDDDENNSSSSSDNATEAGIVAGVIVGVLLLMICLLILLGLIGLLFVKKDDSGKFSENVISTRKDYIDADEGTTTEHRLQDDTRVEFPDIDASTRLSVA